MAPSRYRDAGCDDACPGCCAISAFTRVFDTLWRRASRRGALLSPGRNGAQRFVTVPALRSSVKNAAPRPGHGASPLVDQVLLQDRHLELERTVVVLVIDEQHADEFLADIDLRRIVLLRPRHYADLLVAEQALEVGVEFPDFLNVHGCLQSNKGFA